MLILQCKDFFAVLKCFVSQQGAANGLLLIENKGEFLNVVTETQKDWISKITITSYVQKLAKNQEQLPLQRAMREQSCSITANRKPLGGQQSGLYVFETGRWFERCGYKPSTVWKYHIHLFQLTLSNQSFKTRPKGSMGRGGEQLHMLNSNKYIDMTKAKLHVFFLFRHAKTVQGT